ncbi:MAG: phasin family protein [Deltaproteobacteria bacterium]|nr:phasin family protein [Deltaproteobacteria bacterium]
MELKDLLKEALSKGETLKDEIATELLNSRVFAELAKSDIFAKAISTVLRTKDEVTRILRDNVKHVLELMDVPTRSDLADLKRKLDSLEKTVDKVGKKAITVKSLKTLTLRKAARKK